ncbi:hypothetical protein T10_2942 [Trichinella papuae]|uniref:Uncharacterized protein n=1 Tax=Trichinella papuae TaxID=268474 RepID=A0A0V1M0G8_9BILA|nr:hypothetical protein T10_9598 [Trichinella papuae]KRZ65293.1 hypothetical protein T10_766 [Trichinella papuae]KRZ65566.1 hypothetical protein T10_2942 [Trichinella papuae]
MKYCPRLRHFIEYVTEMSEMFRLLKCKHPGSVLRELQRGCFPVYDGRHCANFRGYLLHQNGIVFDESLEYPLLYHYLGKYYKKGEKLEKSSHRKRENSH